MRVPSPLHLPRWRHSLPPSPVLPYSPTSRSGRLLLCIPLGAPRGLGKGVCHPVAYYPGPISCWDCVRVMACGHCKDYRERTRTEVVKMPLQSSDASTMSWCLEDMVMRKDAQQLSCWHVLTWLWVMLPWRYAASLEPVRCQMKEGRNRSSLNAPLSPAGWGLPRLHPIGDSGVQPVCRALINCLPWASFVAAAGNTQGH